MNRINSTRFLEVEELRTSLEKVDLKESSYAAGGVPLSASSDSVWVDNGDSHTIIFGATGSKKTRMLVMPTAEILGRAGESFVVTDPKGEVHRRTSGSMKSRGYQVITLNFRDYEAGEAWNPLLLPYRYYMAGNIAKATELVSSIAAMLVEEHNLKDRYWSNSARDVAMGIILLLFERAENEEQCSIRNMLALWQEYRRSRADFIGEIMEVYKGGLIADKLQCLSSKAKVTVGSIEAVYATGVNRFVTNEKLISFLSQKGLDFNALTQEKTAIYLIIPDENKFYHFIVSLFLEQLYEVLIEKAQRSEGFRLPCRMNFLVDEFANLPKIENMDSMITASRSRNIRFVLVVQSMNQLKEKYDKAAQIICSNCSNWIYLYSKEYDLLTQISRLCGEVIYDNHLQMPLVSEFDLQHLSKETGEALVLHDRSFPCLVNLLDIDEYPFEAVGWREERRSLGSVPALGEERIGGGAVGAGVNRAYGIRRLPEGWEECAFGSGSSRGDDQKLVYLFETFQGMVTGTYQAKEEEVLDGTAVMRICLQDHTPGVAAQLEWYYGSLALYNKCRAYLRLHPEQVYLTVEEIGELDEEQLIPTENTLTEWGKTRENLSEKVQRWGVDCYEGWVTKLVILEDEEEKEGFTKWLEVRREEIGMRFVINQALRLANNRLKGERFEKIPWLVEREGRGIQCSKWIDGANYAVLTLKYDYFVW